MVGTTNKSIAAMCADSHHLSQHSLIGCFPMTPAGTTGRVSATALREARRPRRPSKTDATVFGIVRRSTP